MKQTFIDRVYKDKNGKIVLAQFPNLPIIIWGAATLLSKIVHTTELSNLLSALSFGALFTWAWLEFFDGDAYFRRLLGLLVIIGMLRSRL